jgi:hypothetical protein
MRVPASPPGKRGIVSATMSCIRKSPTCACGITIAASVTRPPKSLLDMLRSGVKPSPRATDSSSWMFGVPVSSKKSNPRPAIVTRTMKLLPTMCTGKSTLVLPAGNSTSRRRGSAIATSFGATDRGVMDVTR